MNIPAKLPFYIHKADAVSGAAPDTYLHPWQGPDQYLEEAIRSGASDETLLFLQTGLGRTFCAALELHHQVHGALIWSECDDRECVVDFRQWAELAIWEKAKPAWRAAQ